MVIEAWINGQLQSRRIVDDSALQDLPGSSWRQNVEFRESKIRQAREEFAKDMNKIYLKGVQVQYILVFQSKIHLIDDNENDSITAHPGGGEGPDGRDAPGDQTNAGR